MPSKASRLALIGLAAVLFAVYVFAALSIVAEINRSSAATAADLSTR
jgi:hypothetical protein